MFVVVVSRHCQGHLYRKFNLITLCRAPMFIPPLTFRTSELQVEELHDELCEERAQRIKTA